MCCVMLNHTENYYIFIKEVSQEMPLYFIYFCQGRGYIDKITQRFGWEGTLKIIMLQHSCSKPHPTWTSQGWGSHSFSRQPVPGPPTPTGKSFFLRFNLNLPFTLKQFPLVLSLHVLVKSPSPALWAPLGTGRVSKVSPETLNPRNFRNYAPSRLP